MMTTFLISQIYHLKCASNGTFCELLGMKNSRRGQTLYMNITHLVQSFLNISWQLRWLFCFNDHSRFHYCEVTHRTETLFFFYLERKKNI